MFTKEQKKEAKRRWFKAVVGKLPYIITSYFIYPFINRSAVREEYYHGEPGWWTRQLWYMLNDDEIGRYQVDYDINKVREKGIDTTTSWGRFKASYWFNVIRNPAYNYSLTCKPVKPHEYSNQELEIDNVKNLKGESIHPLLRAEWKWITKEGRIDNVGEEISVKHSKVGEGLVWYNPNNDTSVLDFRYSKAWRKTIMKTPFYITIQYGAWSVKYDLVIKIQKGKNEMKLPEIPNDKLKHFIWGAIGSFPMIIFLGPWGLGVSLLIFAAKEIVIDYLMKKGNPELMDFIYSAIPAIMFYILTLL
jgi:hypothetical protein